MKKIFFFILNIFILPLFLIAQCGYNTNGNVSAWKWINPYPSNKTLYSTVFFNENFGYSCIDFRIFRTNDGGINWIVPGDTNINSIFIDFQNASTGYKACIGGIYKTTNSGINWNFFYNVSFSNGSISSLCCYPENYFIFSYTYYSPFGAVASLWYTSNNGINWANPIFPGAEYISNIKFIRNDFAIALAIDSNKLYLLKSNLPAVIWNEVFTGVNEMYSSELFVKDSINYFIVTSNNIMYKTTNEGQNWVQVTLTEIKSMQFPTSNIGVAVGKNGKIFRSIDGCENWYQIQFPYLYNYEAVTFCNSLTGYISGDFGSFLKSTNGGANWFSESKYFTKQAIRDVKTIGRDTVILCGDSGYVFSSYNQGFSWSVQKPGLNNYMFRIFFINKSLGYAIGRNGTILRTVNSGLNWMQLNSGISEFWMNDIFFINENTGFLATGVGGFSVDGYLYKTTNGGSNFCLINTPSNKRFYAVRFLDSFTGFTADISGNIYRTTDIGVTWMTMNTPQSLQSILDFQFINSSTGFAVGYYGYLLKTVDGGLNWSIWNRLNTTGLYRIKFLNDNTGFITAGGGSIGGTGEIFYTTNGGDIWNETYLDLDVYNNILYSIDFANDSLGYVVGEYGIVLKTALGGIVDIKRGNIKYPEKCNLLQNLPNPFNNTTKIKYKVKAETNSQKSIVRIDIYDILGKKVETLVNEKKTSGTYEVSWNASKYPSGIYFYRLETEGFTDTKKMILIK